MKVGELPLPLLNYWVARSLNLPVVFEGGEVVLNGDVPEDFTVNVGWDDLEPGKVRGLDFVGDKALGHSVIEWIGISIERPVQNQTIRNWRAVADWRGAKIAHKFQGPVSATGKTALIAAMRALVAATQGGSVAEIN